LLFTVILRLRAKRRFDGHCARRSRKRLTDGDKLTDRRWVIASAMPAILHLCGCASLDARQDIQRSAAAMEQAVGAPAELLLRDTRTAEKVTRALLADGLSPEEAAQVALLNNPRVRAAMLSVGVSRADFVQSTLFSNPTLSLAFRIPDGGGTTGLESNLAQNIAELWLMPARKQAAQRDLDRVVLEAARTASTVVLETRRAYVQAALADAQIELAERGHEIAADLVKMAEARRQAGSGSAVDVSLARTQRLQAETNLRNVRLNAAQSRADLNRLLGLTGDPQKLALTDPHVEPPSQNMSSEKLQAIARQARLDLRIMEQKLASARARARLERARFLRSFDVGFAFELGARRSRGDRDFFEESFFNSLQSGSISPPSLMPRPQRGTNLVSGPSLAVELPLWDQNQAQIAKADRLLAQTRQRRDAKLVDVARDIYTGLAQVRTATQNARVFREQLVPTAERNVKLAQEGYRIGQVPFLSLLEAQRAYIATRRRQLDTLQNAALAVIELERATGKPATTLFEAAVTRPASENRSIDSTLNTGSES